MFEIKGHGPLKSVIRKGLQSVKYILNYQYCAKSIGIIAYLVPVTTNLSEDLHLTFLFASVLRNYLIYEVETFLVRIGMWCVCANSMSFFVYMLACGCA